MDLERAEEIASALVSELEPIETQNESMARNLVPVLADIFQALGLAYVPPEGRERQQAW